MSKPSIIIVVVGAILILLALGAWLGAGGKGPDEPDISAVREAIEDTDYDQAVRVIQRQPPDRVGIFVHSMSRRLRGQAQPVLMRLMDRDVEPDGGLRSRAASGLNYAIVPGRKDMADDPAVRLLVQAMKTDPSATVRVAAAKTLGHSRAYPVLDEIFNALEDDDPNVRQAALEACEKILSLKLEIAVRPDKPDAKELATLRKWWNDPGVRIKVEGYYETRFKRVYEKYAR